MAGVARSSFSGQRSCLPEARGQYFRGVSDMCGRQLSSMARSSDYVAGVDSDSAPGFRGSGAQKDGREPSSLAQPVPIFTLRGRRRLQPRLGGQSERYAEEGWTPGPLQITSQASTPATLGVQNRGRAGGWTPGPLQGPIFRLRGAEGSDSGRVQEVKMKGSQRSDACQVLCRVCGRCRLQPRSGVQNEGRAGGWTPGPLQGPIFRLRGRRRLRPRLEVQRECSADGCARTPLDGPIPRLRGMRRLR